MKKRLSNATFDEDRESEKAHFLSILLVDGTRGEVWMPKSQMSIDDGIISVEDWIMEKKEEDVGTKFELHPDDAEK